MLNPRLAVRTLFRFVVLVLSGTGHVHGTEHRRLVVGGQLAPPYTYPFMALVGIYSPWTGQFAIFCGGQIMDSRHVLTAAHCVQEDYGMPYIVFVGVHDVDELVGDLSRIVHDGKTAQYALVSQRHVHPGFDRTRTVDVVIDGQTFRMNEFNNDGAVLTLASDIGWPAITRMAPDPPPGSNVRVVGWGHDGSGSVSDVPRWLDMDTTTTQQCFEAYLPAYVAITSEAHVCAGGVRGYSACNGDSGGPLLLSQPRPTGVGEQSRPAYDQWTLLGLVSFSLSPSPDCGAQYDEPTVYARVRGMRAYLCEHAPDAQMCVQDAAPTEQWPPYGPPPPLVTPPQRPPGFPPAPPRPPATPPRQPAMLVVSGSAAHGNYPSIMVGGLVSVLERQRTDPYLTTALAPRFVAMSSRDLETFVSERVQVTANLHGDDSRLVFLDHSERTSDGLANASEFARIARENIGVQVRVDFSEALSALRQHRVTTLGEGSPGVLTPRAKFVVNGGMRVGAIQPSVAPMFGDVRPASLGECTWSNTDPTATFRRLENTAPTIGFEILRNGTLPMSLRPRGAQAPFSGPSLQQHGAFGFGAGATPPSSGTAGAGGTVFGNGVGAGTIATGTLPSGLRPDATALGEAGVDDGGDGDSGGMAQSLPAIFDGNGGSLAASPPPTDAADRPSINQLGADGIAPSTLDGAASSASGVAALNRVAPPTAPPHPPMSPGQFVPDGDVRLAVNNGQWAFIQFISAPSHEWNHRTSEYSYESVAMAAMGWHLSHDGVVDDFVIVNAEIDLQDASDVSSMCGAAIASTI